MIKYIKGLKQTNLVGAEIGVFKGTHAISILENLPVKKLFLVDPYLPYFEGGVLVNPISARKVALQLLRNFGHFVTWVDDVNLPNDLDFVYIDGNHDYKFVKKDLNLYYDKVREKGVLGGHDFSNQFPGVIKAVSEFAVTRDLNLFIEQPDWWVVKKS